MGISLICIIISFIVDALYDGIVLMCVEYGCTGIALIFVNCFINNYNTHPILAMRAYEI